MHSYPWLFIPLLLQVALSFSNTWYIATQSTNNTHRTEANLEFYANPIATNFTSSTRLSLGHKAVTMDECHVIKKHLWHAIFLLTNQYPPTNSHIAKAPSRGHYSCWGKQEYKPKEGKVILLCVFCLPGCYSRRLNALSHLIKWSSYKCPHFSDKNVGLQLLAQWKRVTVPNPVLLMSTWHSFYYSTPTQGFFSVLVLWNFWWLFNWMCQIRWRKSQSSMEIFHVTTVCILFPDAG